MKASQIAKVKMMAERGEPGDRKAANHLLEKQGIKTTPVKVAPVKPAQSITVPRPPKWKGDGVARPEGGNPILSSQIKHFLNAIDENKSFTYKDVGYCDGFGSGHFYGIVNFLESYGLIVKQGSRYTVKSKRAIRDAWNKIMEDAKV